MVKTWWLLTLLFSLASWTFAQQAPTAPADETRSPVDVRSPYSTGADLALPLCPAHFHDGLGSNGIAGPQDQGVTPPKAAKEVPAKMTFDAIRTAGKTHIGNYMAIVNVVVDRKGNPAKLCLEKSAGYGLDASAAAAVRQYRFDSAEKGGKPVPMRVPVEVRFVTPNPPESAGPIPASPAK